MASFYSWYLDYFPYSALLLFTEVSWLFPPLLHLSHLMLGLFFVWQVCQDGPFLRLHQQTCQSLCLWKCVSLFISPSCFSEGGTFPLNTFLSWFTWKWGSTCKLSVSVMGREELTTLHITQVSVVQANMSRIPCYGSHRQTDLPDRKLTWQHYAEWKEKMAWEVYL